MNSCDFAFCGCWGALNPDCISALPTRVPPLYMSARTTALPERLRSSLSELIADAPKAPPGPLTRDEFTAIRRLSVGEVSRLTCLHEVPLLSLPERTPSEESLKPMPAGELALTAGP